MKSKTKNEIRKDILKALRDNNDYFDKAVEQVKKIKSKLNVDLSDRKFMKDFCMLLEFKELEGLVKYVPAEYEKIIKYCI